MILRLLALVLLTFLGVHFGKPAQASDPVAQWLDWLVFAEDMKRPRPQKVEQPPKPRSAEEVRAESIQRCESFKRNSKAGVLCRRDVEAAGFKAVEVGVMDTVSHPPIFHLYQMADRHVICGDNTYDHMGEFAECVILQRIKEK